MRRKRVGGGGEGGREGRGNWPSSLPRDNRALDLKTRTTTSTRFNLKVFSRTVEKYSTRQASLYYCSPEILVRQFFLEVWPFLACIIIKLLKFDKLFPPL